MDKPATIQADLENLPAVFWPYRDLRIWCLWSWVLVKDRWTKPPFQPNGAHAKSQGEDTWCTYAEAIEGMRAGKGDGIGIMLFGMKQAEIIFDIDHCRDPATGAIDAWAQEIIDEAASYTEVTPSGSGVRVLGHGDIGRVHRRFNNVGGIDGGVEVYTAGEARYITVTGLQVPGCWPVVSNIAGVAQRLVENKGKLRADQPTLTAPTLSAKDFEPAPAYQPSTRVGSLGLQLGHDDVGELDLLIRQGVPQGQRSEQFYRAVGLAKRLRWTPEKLDHAMRQNPYGIAQKYLFPDRLNAEIARAWGKVEDEPEYTVTAVLAEKAAQSSDRFQWITHQTGTQPVLNGNWLIKNVLPAEGLGVIFGRPGSGKTFSVMDIAMHVAGGIKWRGKKVTPADVSYVSPEAGRLGVNRVIGWSRHHGIAWPQGFRLSPASINLCSDATDAEALVADIKANQPSCRLVVIDTLNRAMAGGDENSGEDMGRFVALCDHIAKELRAFVLVVHHSGKDAAKGSRGHSSLLGAVSLELEVTKEQGQPGTIKVTKMRDGEDGAEYGFDIDSVPLGHDEDGEEVTTGIAVEADATEVKAAKAAEPNGKNQKLVADAFAQYVDDYGRPNPPGTGFAEPGRVRVVEADALVEFAAGKMVGGKPHEKRKTVREAVHGLVAKGFFSVNGGLLWRVR